MTSWLPVLLLHRGSRVSLSCSKLLHPVISTNTCLPRVPVWASEPLISAGLRASGLYGERDYASERRKSAWLSSPIFLQAEVIWSPSKTDVCLRTLRNLAQSAPAQAQVPPPGQGPSHHLPNLLNLPGSPASPRSASSDSPLGNSHPSQNRERQQILGVG